MVNSERTEPEGLSAWQRLMRPTALGMALATMWSSQARAPGPSTVYLANEESSMSPTRSRMVATSAATCGNQLERRNE
jgi:hypothetical protein